MCQYSVPSVKKMQSQLGTLLHWKLLEKVWLWYVGCNLFFSFWFSRRNNVMVVDDRTSFTMSLCLPASYHLPACQVCGEEEGGEKNCKSQTQVDHLQSVGTISYIWKRGVWESWRTPSCNICGLLTWPKYSSCLSLTPCREEAVPRHADARQPRTKSSYKNIKICSALTNFDG